jgi:hypothetical protein
MAWHVLSRITYSQPETAWHDMAFRERFRSAALFPCGDSSEMPRVGRNREEGEGRGGERGWLRLGALLQGALHRICCFCEVIV